MHDRLISPPIEKLKEVRLSDLSDNYGKEGYASNEAIALATTELWLNVLYRVSKRRYFRINGYDFLGHWIEVFMKKGGLQKAEIAGLKKDENVILLSNCQFAYHSGHKIVLPVAQTAVVNRLESRKAILSPVSDMAVLVWNDQPNLETLEADGYLLNLPNLILQAARLIEAVNNNPAGIQLTRPEDNLSEMALHEGNNQMFKF